MDNLQKIVDWLSRKPKWQWHGCGEVVIVVIMVTDMVVVEMVAVPGQLLIYCDVQTKL